MQIIRNLLHLKSNICIYFSILHNSSATSYKINSAFIYSLHTKRYYKNSSHKIFSCALKQAHPMILRSSAAGLLSLWLNTWWKCLCLQRYCNTRYGRDWECVTSSVASVCQIFMFKNYITCEKSHLHRKKLNWKPKSGKSCSDSFPIFTLVGVV